MRLSLSFSIALLIAAILLLLQISTADEVTSASSSTPVTLPISFYGLNYNTRKGPDWAPDLGRCKSRAEVVRDLTLLGRLTTRIRLLSLVDCNQGALVWSVLNNELASLQMETWLGLWVGPDHQVFVDERNALAVILPDILGTPNWEAKLSGISVGSEAIYREDVTVPEAIANLESIRSLLSTFGVSQLPVSIVDIAPVYSANPELRIASDVIMANTFPFWEALPISAAINELELDLGWLINLPESTNKPFVLSEHGWPSDGFEEFVGSGSPQHQQRYLAESHCYLQERGWASYWFTAIDNDWRQLQDPDNTIEGNWGFLTADLELKDHFVNFGFSCDTPVGSVRYTFEGVDWTIPELSEEEHVDGGRAWCGLWSGCQELAGDCCPTPGGDYLGCCSSENFLGNDDDNNNNGNNNNNIGNNNDNGNDDNLNDDPDPPDSAPTEAPTQYPATMSPTKVPSQTPTTSLVLFPTNSPTDAPTKTPTKLPTETPTVSPTKRPTTSSIPFPTNLPMDTPTKTPTNFPTEASTVSITTRPTTSSMPFPTNPPTDAPTKTPTRTPTEAPTVSPTTRSTTPPVQFSTDLPTNPTTKFPTEAPTNSPTRSLWTDSPTTTSALVESVLEDEVSDGLDSSNADAGGTTEGTDIENSNNNGGDLPPSMSSSFNGLLGDESSGSCFFQQGVLVMWVAALVSIGVAIAGL